MSKNNWQHFRKETSQDFCRRCQIINQCSTLSRREANVDVFSVPSDENEQPLKRALASLQGKLKSAVEPEKFQLCTKCIARTSKGMYHDCNSEKSIENVEENRPSPIKKTALRSLKQGLEWFGMSNGRSVEVEKIRAEQQQCWCPFQSSRRFSHAANVRWWPIRVASWIMSRHHHYICPWASPWNCSMNSRCTNERWDCKVASTKGETAEKSSLQNFVEELQLEASTKVNVVIKNYWKLFKVS